VSIWKIVLKNIAQRKLSSTLTAASIALGVAVVVAVLAIKAQSRQAFGQSAVGYDLVAGAKGSKLQLVLNTVYHLDQAPGLLAFSVYEKYRGDRRVRLAAPVAVGGDTYRGHPVVGTSDLFLRDFEVQPGQKFELARGRLFAFDEGHLRHLMTAPPDHRHEGEKTAFEAVLGSAAARSTGLDVGSAFVVRHGGESGEEHEERWTVVGLLKPTGTANDRAVFINLESFLHIKDHQAEAVVRGKITAVVFKTKGAHAANHLAAEINDGAEATAAIPAAVMADLFDLVGRVDLLLLAVAALVILVAAVSILVSIYNSMAERRRAIAIMRALGARRALVLAIILLEASALCLFGGVAGLALGHGLTAAAGQVLAARAGVTVSAVAFLPEELFVLAGVLVLGALAGVLPALKAYWTDIADGLSPTA
jgi:putative ABC transport system permease protein